jgi:hypothetical protein
MERLFQDRGSVLRLAAATLWAFSCFLMDRIVGHMGTPGSRVDLWRKQSAQVHMPHASARL